MKNGKNIEYTFKIQLFKENYDTLIGIENASNFVKLMDKQNKSNKKVKVVVKFTDKTFKEFIDLFYSTGYNIGINSILYCA